MKTVNMTSKEALALVEAHSGYCLSEDQIAVVALDNDGGLVCVASLRDVQEPVAVVERVQQQIKENGNADCEFFTVGKNAGHVLTLQEHGIRCFLGISDDAELSYLSYRSTAKSRDEFIEEWSFRAAVQPAQITWDQDALEGRQEALRGVLTGASDGAPDRIFFSSRPAPGSLSGPHMAAKRTHDNVGQRPSRVRDNAEGSGAIH